jgi:hypothetical protein
MLASIGNAMVENANHFAKVEGSSLFSAAASGREKKTVNKVEASFVLCNV